MVFASGVLIRICTVTVHGRTGLFKKPIRDLLEKMRDGVWIYHDTKQESEQGTVKMCVMIDVVF